LCRHNPTVIGDDIAARFGILLSPCDILNMNAECTTTQRLVPASPCKIPSCHHNVWISCSPDDTESLFQTAHSDPSVLTTLARITARQQFPVFETELRFLLSLTTASDP
jgi:hypothetical protein